jgi:hypothetical protein
MISEKEEARIRSEAMLMFERNRGNEYILQRIFKRFIRCLKN